MYKFQGLLENKSRWADLEGPDGIYFVKISARMFAPFFAVTVYQPRRRGAWRLVTEPFDYRAAQHSGALEPRDGPWYSRSEVTLHGDMALTCPESDPDLPTTITVIMRISWWPVHVAATWLDGGEGFQKLSARPKENTPCDWRLITYDDSVFTDEDRRRFPAAFVDSIPCPPPPGPSAPDPTSAAQPEKEPSASPHPDSGKQSQSEDSHTSNHGESDYSDDWWNDSGDHWWDKGHWSAKHWNDWWCEPQEEVRWSEPSPPKNTDPPAETVVTESAPPIPDEPPSTESSAPVPWHEAPLDTPRGMDPHSAAPVIASSTAGSIRVEQVTVHTKTQSMEVSPAVSSQSQEMFKLHRLALRGPPLSREDRLARQTLAAHLSLSPELYNMLVFGESSDTEESAPSLPALTGSPSPSP